MKQYFHPIWECYFRDSYTFIYNYQQILDQNSFFCKYNIIKYK